MIEHSLTHWDGLGGPQVVTEAEGCLGVYWSAVDQFTHYYYKHHLRCYFLGVYSQVSSSRTARPVFILVSSV